MAINLASKYSNKVVERFYEKSKTQKGLNTDYDWSGVKTVTVYNIATATMNDYNRTLGSNRYGTPAELDDTKQDLTLTKDRSFTFIIDKGNQGEQMNVKEAGKALARQVREVVTPEIDKYRLAAWVAATNTQLNDAVAVALSTSNAYSKLLQAQAKLDDEMVPEVGRRLYASATTINMFKQDTNFNLDSDVAMNKKISGLVGEADGVEIVKVPSTWMPTNCGFILIHPSCSCSPLKLEDYKIHDNPPGISGKLVEGRVIYDCFVFDALGKAIVKHMNA